MPDPENVAAVASEWVNKAENDLRTAAHSLRLGKACPTDTVSFHAQQAVKKSQGSFDCVRNPLSQDPQHRDTGRNASRRCPPKSIQGRAE
jgi:hypothetical protein